MEVGFIDNFKDNELFDTRFAEIVKVITKAILDEVGIPYKEEATIPVDKYYRVQVGAFANKANAENTLKKIKEIGRAHV